MKYQRMSHKTYEITRGIKRRLVKEVRKKRILRKKRPKMSNAAELQSS